MNTMCCEMSYLYIRLLIQLSYLTYVGFLNMERGGDGGRVVGGGGDDESGLEISGGNVLA
jgi:hypothetical protein